MLVIGERINGMFRAVRDALQNRDKTVIHKLARSQLKAGANYLDVNVGPAADPPLQAMEWLVTTIREVSKAPLALDSPKVEVIEAGLKLAGSQAMINATDARPTKLEVLMPLAQKYKVPIIGLTMNERGIPGDAAGRAEMALRIVASAMEHDVPTDQIYLDPIILPCSVTQPTCLEVLETIRQCKLLCHPPPKTVIGISNVSQGARHRELINRVYLVMALNAGLDAAIMDPLDTALMDTMITTEMLLIKTIYGDDYLKAGYQRA